MEIVLYLLSIFSLAFLIKESDGPWGIMAWIRNKLMSNKYVGVFFYKLLSCWHCTGMHAGWVIYLIATPFNKLELRSFVLWSLAGGAICYIINLILEKIQAQD